MFLGVKIADLLSEVGLEYEPYGVLKVPGRCAIPNYTEKPEYAYRFSDRSELSVSTGQLFQQFPQDFSMLFVVKFSKGIANIEQKAT